MRTAALFPPPGGVLLAFALAALAPRLALVFAALARAVVGRALPTVSLLELQLVLPAMVLLLPLSHDGGAVSVVEDVASGRLNSTAAALLRGAERVRLHEGAPALQQLGDASPRFGAAGDVLARDVPGRHGPLHEEDAAQLLLQRGRTVVVLLLTLQLAVHRRRGFVDAPIRRLVMSGCLLGLVGDGLGRGRACGRLRSTAGGGADRPGEGHSHLRRHDVVLVVAHAALREVAPDRHDDLLGEGPVDEHHVAGAPRLRAEHLPVPKVAKALEGADGAAGDVLRGLLSVVEAQVAVADEHARHGEVAAPGPSSRLGARQVLQGVVHEAAAGRHGGRAGAGCGDVHVPHDEAERARCRLRSTAGCKLRSIADRHVEDLPVHVDGAARRRREGAFRVFKKWPDFGRTLAGFWPQFGQNLVGKMFKHVQNYMILAFVAPCLLRKKLRVFAFSHPLLAKNTICHMFVHRS